MRFRDMLCGENISETESRWARYQAHLLDVGLTTGDPLLRLFGFNVFHDRPVRFRRFKESSGECEILLVNSYSLNQAETRRRRTGGALPVNPIDLETSVVFGGVSEARRTRWDQIADPYYYQAEIDRSGSGYLLEIGIGDLENFEGQHALLAVQFRHAEIEDISEKIMKYFDGDIETARKTTSSIDYTSEDDARCRKHSKKVVVCSRSIGRWRSAPPAVVVRAGR